MVSGFLNLSARLVGMVLISIAAVSCVTETVDSPNSMRFSDAAVIAVQDPNIFVTKGSTFAWLPEAIRFYEDERLENTPVKSLIEKEIVKNMLAKEMVLVDSVNGAKYAIAYTAALESSLDDSAIIQRFGLLPGNSQVPQDDSNIEKGTLVIYVFENRTNDVVWRSAAQVGVKFDTSADERKQRVERVLAEMFQTFKVTE
jgi:hypothetical protein